MRKPETVCFSAQTRGLSASEREPEDCHALRAEERTVRLCAQARRLTASSTEALQRLYKERMHKVASMHVPDLASPWSWQACNAQTNTPHKYTTRAMQLLARLPPHACSLQEQKRDFGMGLETPHVTHHKHAHK